VEFEVALELLSHSPVI